MTRIIYHRNPLLVPVFLLLAGIALMLAGCGAPQREEVKDLKELQGFSLQEVTKKLGLPTETQEYTIAEAPTKGWNHGILFDTYPKTDPVNRDVKIKESTWEDGDYLIKVCFHSVGEEWTVLGASRFHKDVRF